MKLKSAAVTTTLTTAMLLAAPANADQYDFVSVLDQSGITYSSVSDAINVGKSICHAIRNNTYVGDVFDALTASGWSYRENSIIVKAATQTMCPDIGAIIQEQIHITNPPPPPPPPPGWTG
ncbi:MAG: DUF732 domain-containing protein [Akkermansiaceae bacterium]|nr:DUF732 domain-containing protein [Akkermansiaceae bacterium]